MCARGHDKSGRHRARKRGNPNDVEGMVRGLRDSTHRIPGIQKNPEEQQVRSIKEKEMQVGKFRARPTSKHLDVKETTSNKTDEDNPADPAAPGDFPQFDLPEMERIGDAIFNAEDDWAHTDGERQDSLHRPVTESQEEIDTRRNRWGPPVGQSVVTFVKNRMIVEGSDGSNIPNTSEKSLMFLSQQGGGPNTFSWRSVDFRM